MTAVVGQDDLMGRTDYAILDIPRATPPEDPHAYLQTALAWHFGPATGSPFWLDIAPTLDFDPISDIRTYADLSRFPNVLNRLRDVTVEDLIPRGYGTPAPIPRVFESGGTTGAPKRTAQLPDWVEQNTRWQIEDFTTGGFVTGAGLLCLVPSGPHGVGFFDQQVSRRLGSTCYTIDLDPRWVKKLTARAAGTEVSGYIEHVLAQARFILSTQRVANLHTTPPLLEAIARDDRLVDLVNDRIRYILLSGAHIDPDTHDLLCAIFPAATITAAFGSTMILSQAITRVVEDVFVFDPRSPYVVFWVVDPHTRAQVQIGERGQVVMNHISKGMFVPNNLERDTAIRMAGPAGQIGDSLADIAPVAIFEGETVIEGVY